jgi:transcriptional regulator with XRE-family HTH domain
MAVEKQASLDVLFRMSKMPTQNQQQTISCRILLARLATNLSQEQVATALELSTNAVVELESGSRTVSTLELSKLAQLFRRPISSFVNDSNLAKQDNDAEDTASTLQHMLDALAVAGRDSLQDGGGSELLILALEAYRKEEITAGKLRDVGTVLGISADTISGLIENLE